MVVICIKTRFVSLSVRNVILPESLTWYALVLFQCSYFILGLELKIHTQVAFLETPGWVFQGWVNSQTLKELSIESPWDQRLFGNLYFIFCCAGYICSTPLFFLYHKTTYGAWKAFQHQTTPRIALSLSLPPTVIIVQVQVEQQLLKKLQCKVC